MNKLSKRAFAGEPVDRADIVIEAPCAMSCTGKHNVAFGFAFQRHDRGAMLAWPRVDRIEYIESECAETMDTDAALRLGGSSCTAAIERVRKYLKSDRYGSSPATGYPFLDRVLSDLHGKLSSRGSLRRDAARLTEREKLAPSIDDAKRKRLYDRLFIQYGLGVDVEASPHAPAAGMRFIDVRTPPNGRRVLTAYGSSQVFASYNPETRQYELMPNLKDISEQVAERFINRDSCALCGNHYKHMHSHRTRVSHKTAFAVAAQRLVAQLNTIHWRSR